MIVRLAATVVLLALGSLASSTRSEEPSVAFFVPSLGEPLYQAETGRQYLGCVSVSGLLIPGAGDALGLDSCGRERCLVTLPCESQEPVVGWVEKRVVRRVPLDGRATTPEEWRAAINRSIAKRDDHWFIENWPAYRCYSACKDQPCVEFKLDACENAASATPTTLVDRSDCSGMRLAPGVGPSTAQTPPD